MFSLLVHFATSQAAPTQVPLDSLDLSSMTTGYGQVHKDLSIDGHPLTIAGKVFPTGVGTHAASEFTIQVDRNAVAFHAMVGMDDDATSQGSAEFNVIVDGHKLAGSGVMHTGEGAKELNVPLKGARIVRLQVAESPDGINFAHADWADSYFTVTNSNKPLKPIKSVEAQQEPTMKIAHMNLTKTEIHGATVVGGTPGYPFIFKIPATGTAPLKYMISGLPNTLAVDNATGIVRGTVPPAGSYPLSVTVSGPSGTDKRSLMMISGDHKLALTPPMGWNSWNVWGTSVNAEKVRASADSFVKSHLADYGYTYVNIDDAWEGGRDDAGMIKTNEKFGDMTALASYVHSLGLRLGVYSSPGPTTCAGYTASYQHELQDAQAYASWGVDYLKYDWCSFGDEPHPEGLPGYELPYQTMRAALDKAPRDIVYSLCQYGMGDVYKWGHTEVGGNLWRTTGDINDSWSSMSSIGFSHSVRSPYAHPGGWNDPDMLVVGKLGWGDHPRQTKLTGNEQITHITLWSMLAAPLIIGCDLTQLDSFTSDLLMNPDVIAIDQDPLGSAATQAYQDGDLEVWTRPLSDGSYAIGLFNRGPAAAKVTTNWQRDLKATATLKIRNLWLRTDVGRSSTGYSAKVPSHGAVLIKVWK